MDTNEKILLIECLLRDIRGNWSELVLRRLKLVQKLCNMITKDESVDESLRKSFSILSKSCADGASYYRDADYFDYFDGRMFRDEFPYGYEEIDQIHKIPKPYKLADRSDEFKKLVNEFITTPHYVFSDVEYNSEEHENKDHLAKIINAIDLNKLSVESIIDIFASNCDCDSCPAEVPCTYHTYGENINWTFEKDIDIIQIDDVCKYNDCKEALYMYLTRKE